MFFHYPFHRKPRPSRVSLESPGLENTHQLPGNQAEVGQNHEARKAVLNTLLVLKWSGAVFRPRSSKVSDQKVLFSSFQCKTRQSGVILASPGIENIRQLPANRAEVGQNYDARKALSASLSVLKWSRAMLRPTSSKLKKNYCVYFTANQGYQ